MTPVRIFHCDDSDAFRLLVRESLRDEHDVEVVGGASTVEQALRELPAAAPDVVLVDRIEREAEDAIVARLRAAAPGARFVVYTGMPEGDGDGAPFDAHVHKSAPFDVLRRVVVEVAARA